VQKAQGCVESDVAIIKAPPTVRLPPSASPAVRLLPYPRAAVIEGRRRSNPLRGSGIHRMCYSKPPGSFGNGKDPLAYCKQRLDLLEIYREACSQFSVHASRLKLAREQADGNGFRKILAETMSLQKRSENARFLLDSHCEHHLCDGRCTPPDSSG